MFYVYLHCQFVSFFEFCFLLNRFASNIVYYCIVPVCNTCLRINIHLQDLAEYEYLLSKQKGLCLR